MQNQLLFDTQMKTALVWVTKAERLLREAPDFFGMLVTYGQLGFTHFQAINEITYSFPTSRQNSTARTGFLYHKCAADQTLGN